MCHDDMVWSAGPFMHPDYYRAEVFPRYRALWKILHDAGKKVAFTSDGDYGMFMDDIVAAGADCLCFEPMTRLEPVAAAYGQTHCLISSKVDARTLTFGSAAEIAAEIDATIELAQIALDSCSPWAITSPAMCRSITLWAIWRTCARAGRAKGKNL